MEEKLSRLWKTIITFSSNVPDGNFLQCTVDGLHSCVWRIVPDGANILQGMAFPQKNKKAELSQRWPRDAPYMGAIKKFWESLTTPMATFLEIFNGLLFRFSL